MSVHVQQDILRLQVTIDDPVLMQCLQPEQNLTKIEPGLVFRKPA
jgi:hypothetical protein